MPPALTWLAAVAVCGAASAWGYLVARQLAQRPQDLAGAAAALEVLRTEIAYARTPLPGALRQAALGAGDPVAALLRTVAGQLEAGSGRSAQQAWDEALAVLDLRSAWTPADLGVLARLGHALGRSDAAEQERHIALCVERLRQLEAEARTASDRQGRMWRYLGVLAGVALVLMVR